MIARTAILLLTLSISATLAAAGELREFSIPTLERLYALAAPHKSDQAVVAGHFLAAVLAVGRPRHQLSGPPRIARGVVERFLIFRKQVLIAEGAGILVGVAALQGGVLVPVSEDEEGIYYQNLNGVWVYDDHYITSRRPLPGIWYRGGLYFSKTKEDAVYAYIGDARNQNYLLEMEDRKVRPVALAQLRIGQVAKGTKKSNRNSTEAGTARKALGR